MQLGGFKLFVLAKVFTNWTGHGFGGGSMVQPPTNSCWIIWFCARDQPTLLRLVGQANHVQLSVKV